MPNSSHQAARPSVRATETGLHMRSFNESTIADLENNESQSEAFYNTGVRKFREKVE